MIRSTREYVPGWTHRKLGEPQEFVWGINLITKGRALAGTFIGAVTADAGSIGTTELATGAVTNPKLGSLAVSTTKVALLAITAARLAATLDLSTKTVTLGVASIGSSELASLAVGTTNVADDAITDAKRSFGWSTLTGTLSASLSTAKGGFLITNTGTTKGLVISGAATSVLSIPVAGDSYRFHVDVNPGATKGIFIKSTGATFDGSKKFVKLGENDQFVVIEAATPTRWVVTSWSTGVSYETTT